MKKLVLLLMSVMTIGSLTVYAGFPITNNNETINIESISSVEIDNSSIELPVSSSFHFGGFALGFLLGALGVLLAYAFSGWKSSAMTRSSLYGLGAWLILYLTLVAGA
jgi:hypothetical protein